MQHQEGQFKGVRGMNIYYQGWLPEGDVRAVLLVVHGVAEHSGRYMNLVNHFVPKGYGIYALDHIGHGKSDGARVCLEKFSDYTDNIKTFFDMIQKWQVGKPVFLVGHSLGGLIASAYLLDHQDELKAAVLSAPAVKVPEDTSPFVLLAGKILSKIAPASGLLQLDARTISRDPAVVTAYKNDPLVYTGKITARLAAEMLTTMQRVTENAHTLRLPILLLQGTEDRLVAPAGAKMLYEKAQSKTKELKVYQGLYHEVFNEPEHHQVLSDVQTWLEALP